LTLDKQMFYNVWTEGPRERFAKPDDGMHNGVPRTALSSARGHVDAVR
jgi:hypothetical protein